MGRENKLQLAFRKDYETQAEYLRAYKKAYNKEYFNKIIKHCDICDKDIKLCNFNRHTKNQVHILKLQLVNSIQFKDKEQ